MATSGDEWWWWVIGEEERGGFIFLNIFEMCHFFLVVFGVTFRVYCCRLERQKQFFKKLLKPNGFSLYHKNITYSLIYLNIFK